MIRDKLNVKISSDAIAQMQKVAQYLEKDHPVTSYDDVILKLCDEYLAHK